VRGHQGDNVRDRWDSSLIAGERDRLMELLFDWQAARATRNAVVLSGDVHAGAAFTVSRKGMHEGRFEQWTASALSSPGGVLHAVANRAATRLVNVGDSLRHAVRQGVEPRNNFGLVELTPRGATSGHQLALTVFGFDPKKQRLHRSISVVLP
jgi:phosphodiesterase/alkaline phosphatase D-like protein